MYDATCDPCQISNGSLILLIKKKNPKWFTIYLFSPSSRRQRFLWNDWRMDPAGPWKERLGLGGVGPHGGVSRSVSGNERSHGVNNSRPLSSRWSLFALSMAALRLHVARLMTCSISRMCCRHGWAVVCFSPQVPTAGTGGQAQHVGAGVQEVNGD